MLYASVGRYEAQRDRVVGLVEHPSQGTVERFSGVNELVDILLVPTQTAEIIASSGAEECRTNTGR